MTYRQTLLLGCAAFLLPTLALAAAPGNVSGITAEEQDGTVVVQWQAPSGTVTGYRVFYSHASILGNDGLYDDFETTQGTATSHVLQNIPPVPELFISVLAVNGEEESPLFADEARIVFGSATGNTPAPDTTTTSSALRLLRVTAVSSTGVLITFSHPLHPAVQTPALFSIATASGVQLAVNQVATTASGTLLYTEPQKPGEPYSLRAAVSLVGVDVDGGAIPLANDQGPVLFTGFDPLQASTMSASSAPSLVPASSSIASSVASSAEALGVQSLRLRAAPAGDGTYTVDVTWESPGSGVAGYQLAQTTDGGLSYGSERLVGAQTTAVQIDGVTAGSFGVRITVLQSDGTRGKSQTQTIDLPDLTPTPPPLTGTVTPPSQPGSSTDLPNAGIGLGMLLMLAGALAGLLAVRRLQPATQ